MTCKKGVNTDVTCGDVSTQMWWIKSWDSQVTMVMPGYHGNARLPWECQVTMGTPGYHGNAKLPWDSQVTIESQLEPKGNNW